MDRETEPQRGAVSGLRPHSKSVAKLGLASRTPGLQDIQERLSLSLERSSVNTHSSTFRPREAHHASLTTGTRGAWGSGATILTSRTLRTEGTEPEVKSEGGWVGGWEGEGPWGEQYSQGGRFCRRDRGCRDFQSDPRGQQTGVSQVGRRGTEEGRGTSGGRPVVRLQGASFQTPHGSSTVLGQVQHRGQNSPWHRADQLHQGDQLHQENLWGQRGRGNHVHRQDPGWGSHRDNQGLRSGLLYCGPASYSSRWGRVGLL